MAIIGNTVSAIGDILYIYTQGAIAGQVQINSYTDTVVGVTPTRFFNKTFRYSLDGLNYSNWEPLTNTNLSNITGSVTSLLFMEFRYERAGTDTTGVLEFQGLELQGDIIIQICNNTVTLDSIFADLACNDMLTATICNNLLKKIYKAGIIPTFIERGAEIDDEDYVAFWGAIACFLAFVSSFANDLDKILYKRKYLTDYLEEKGLFFCKEEILFSELQYLANNFYDEIRKRGTQQTYKKKGDVLLDGSIVPLDGEWLRLICRNTYDEFLVDVVSKERHGYCVGNSSPLYNGNYKSKQINKTEENTDDFVDLTLYDIQNTANVNIVNDLGEEVAEMNGDGLDRVGFGFPILSPPHITLPEKLIIVDKEIDYEITFKVKRKAGSTGQLWFGVHGYNRNSVYKPLSFLNIDNGLVGNYFFIDLLEETTKIEDQWYEIRGIIYAANSQNITNPSYSKTNTIGRNLKFNFNEDIERLKPFVQIYGDNSTDSWSIHNFKMRPLIKGKNILNLTNGGGHGVRNPQFVQGDVITMNWLKNNNERFTDSEVHNKIQDFLLPYEQKLISINLSPKVDDKQLLL